MARLALPGIRSSVLPQAALSRQQVNAASRKLAAPTHDNAVARATALQTFTGPPRALHGKKKPQA